MNRRALFQYFLLIPAAISVVKLFQRFRPSPKVSTMIKHIAPIDLHWPTQEPFLFCAHHLDLYPRGNQNLGLDPVHFQGRNMGADFEEKDGFRLYHGGEIPGFPVHPHRGFETITIVRRGFADHADSLGAAGRYGEGDVQWMTAGSGVQHSEMFPLLHQDQDNTLELFQIWLNLPRKNKMVSPDFKMLWSENIPKIKTDKFEVSLICGEYGETKFYEAPKDSWASDPGNQVNILLVKLSKGASFEYPKKLKVNRSLYFFNNSSIRVNEELISGKKALFVDSESSLMITADEESEFLILEGNPIGEPVVQHGPFVMNSREEIYQTIRDYQLTQFGGWKWKREDMIHGPGTERFAKYPDGRVDRPKV